MSWAAFSCPLFDARFRALGDDMPDQSGVRTGLLKYHSRYFDLRLVKYDIANAFWCYGRNNVPAHREEILDSLRSSGFSDAYLEMLIDDWLNLPRCRNHADKLVKPSAWIRRGRRLCTWCINHQPGQAAASRRYRTSEHGKEQRNFRARKRRTMQRVAESAL